MKALERTTAMRGQQRVVRWLLHACGMLLLLVGMAVAVPVMAEEPLQLPDGIKKGSIGALLLQAPQEILPTITVKNRLEALQKYQMLQRGQVSTSEPATIFNIPVQVKVLTEQYLQMELDPHVELQMLKLPLYGWGRYLVAIILTHQRPGVPTQSVIAFYDKKWQQQPMERWFALPDAEAFLQGTEGKISQYALKAALGQVLHPSYRMFVGSDARSLLLEWTTYDDARFESTPKPLEPFIRPIKLVWHKRKGFVR